MATDNKQKVLIRSMSIEELEKYMVNSDLNGKIIPKNEGTWHQNYDEGLSYYMYAGCILTNETKTNTNRIFLNRDANFGLDDHKYHKDNYSNKSIHNLNSSTVLSCFRPLIEYKE